MRFMMFMIPAVYQGGKAKRAVADFTPPADAVEKMAVFNEALAKSGAMLSADGFHPIEKGARVSFANGTPTVVDGSEIDNQEILGGYWMVQFKSKEEAIEWARRVPAAEGDVIEIRQVYDMEDFPEDIQKAAKSEEIKSEIEKHR